MPSPSLPVVVVAVLLVAVIGASAKHLTLTLERVNHDGVELSRLRDRDRVRHARFLQQKQPNGVVDFPVSGTYNPFVAGLYYTTVTLGNPPRDFYVQIDTGSDVLWVTCNPCSGCPKSSGLKIPINFFNPSSSSSSSVVSCSDNACATGTQSSDSLCTSQGQCGYKFQYGDGSGASGYYVSDAIHLDTVANNEVASNFSTPVVFGCSTSVTGDLTKSDSAVDGIFGFGQRGLSVIAQLSSQGITPNAFSHCLSGQSSGGGILALGQVVDPSIVYTPMVPSQPHYNVDLQSIYVAGQKVAIDSSAFTTSPTSGTIIDSGTTLGYLADSAYDPVINAIKQAANAQSVPIKGNECFATISSVSDAFPNVTLNFANSATMVLTPHDYLLPQGTNNGPPIWCIGLLKTDGEDLTILGDIVLKDKVVVYDIAGQRIGWTNYDCSSSVTISTSNSNKTQSFDGGLLNKNSNSNSLGLRHEPFKQIHSIAMALLLHIAFFGVSNSIFL